MKGVEKPLGVQIFELTGKTAVVAGACTRASYNDSLKRRESGARQEQDEVQ
jgi:hypothetical protein